MKTCVCCNKTKRESEFYLKEKYQFGTHYEYLDSSCIECRRKKQLEYYHNKKKGITKENMRVQNGLSLVDTVYTPKSKKNTKEYSLSEDSSWIYHNLKRYGNCYVSKSRGLTKQDIEHQIKSKVKMTAVEGGYIVEVCSNAS